MILTVLTESTAALFDAALCVAFNVCRSFTHNLVYLGKVALVLIEACCVQANRHLYHGANTCICKGPKRRTVVDTVKETVSRMSAAVG